jgi:dUTPase
MGAYFEKVSRFADVDIPIPVRATANSAGYDLAAAESIDIPPLSKILDTKVGKDWIEDLDSVEKWIK